VGSSDTVSCYSPGNCVAAGDYQDSSGNLQGVLEVLANGTWSTTEAPMPPNFGSFPLFFGAGCSSAFSCYVVGLYKDTAGLFAPLIETLANGAWTATEPPLPADSGTDGDGFLSTLLSGVTCQAGGSCVIVGTYFDNMNYQYGLALTQSGSTWTPSQVPLPPNTGTDTDLNARSALQAVSCPPSPGLCEAVGSYDDTTGKAWGLIETLANGTWSATQAPQPSNAGTGVDQGAELNDVSCPSAGECVAGGDYHDAAAFSYPMADTLVNATWTPAQLPLPSNAGDDSDLQSAYIFSVSCPVAGQCVAVGRYKDTGQYGYGLIETLSANGTWSAATPQQPANAGSDTTMSQYASLNMVSCSWPGQCDIVGYYQDAHSHDHGFIISESGGTTTTMESPYPGPISSTNPNVNLAEVSCVAAMCAVGGSFEDASNHQQGLLDTYVGSGGYNFAASDGGIFSYNTPFFGSMGGQPLNEPVVGITIDPATDGYYEVASDGGMFAFNAPFQGSMGGQPLNAPIVAMAFDTLTGGYYEVASDGGIFAFNAPFYGSMGGKPLNKPIVDIAFDPATGGYYEVASDGGLFAFGAPFFGSMGGQPLNEPVVGMTVDTSTNGYYEVATDGGLFAFGAPFLGSTGNITLNKPMVGMAFNPYTNGYYEVASDGGIFAYNTPFFGSTGNITLNQPVIGMGTT